jgi:serine/threonine protein kinase
MDRAAAPQQSTVSDHFARDSRRRGNLLAGRYRVVSFIGAGGVGEVFLARDTQLERSVAIKLLQADLQEDASARERFRREAMAAAALDHPFICKVFEIGNADGRLFIVMEFIEGETLQTLARRGLLPLRRVIEIGSELVQALEEAHRRGVIHRDLKPANVMITPQGHVKVMDFGLAKRITAAPLVSGEKVPEMALTGLWMRLGTPAYMSPEQIVGGGSLDGRSDIFSIGVILYELVTGRHPFLRDDATQTMASILRDPPIEGGRKLDSLPGLSTVLSRVLRKARAERTQTMGELAVELEALRDRAWASIAPRSVGPESARLVQRTPFVGRETETTELTRQLDRMLHGQGSLNLIDGELGVGKTRLAQELLQEARQRGCLCLTGHCYEMEGAPPFVPFIEMTEQAVRAESQLTRATMGDYAPEIASLVPTLRRTYSDIPPIPEVPAGQQRRLVFGAYLEYIQRCAQKLPIVALFDDLHWADDPTLQLLLHVAPHLASMRMLVVAT